MMAMQALPDRHTEILEMVAEGDKVVARIRMTGTNTGGFPMFNVPANGNKVDIEWISIYTVKDGKATDHRAVMDLMGLMQQIGAIPAPGAPAR
jgi:predicted ester cyclase